MHNAKNATQQVESLPELSFAALGLEAENTKMNITERSKDLESDSADRPGLVFAEALRLGYHFRMWASEPLPCRGTAVDSDAAVRPPATTTAPFVLVTFFSRPINPVHIMATPVIIGVGAIAAAIAGRSLMRRGMLGGKGAAEQWVKGGFKAKMDRKEAIAILGLK